MTLIDKSIYIVYLHVHVYKNIYPLSYTMHIFCICYLIQKSYCHINNSLCLSFFSFFIYTQLFVCLYLSQTCTFFVYMYICMFNDNKVIIIIIIIINMCMSSLYCSSTSCNYMVYK